MKLAEEAEPHLTGAKQQEWLKLLEDEHDNIRAVLRWATEARSEEAAGPEPTKEGWREIGLRTAGAIWRFWLVRGLFTEGREHLWRALSMPEVVLQACSLSGRAKSLNGAGILAHRQGDYSSARSLLEAALALGQEAEDKQNIALSLLNLGNVATEQGDSIGARALYEESLDLRRELGDKGGIAASLGLLGHLAYGQGDYTSARALYEESLALQREMGDKKGTVAILAGLGGVVVGVGAEMGVGTGVRQVARGARLLGAVEGLMQSMGAVLDLDDQHLLYEPSVQQARAQLGEEGFEKARQEGRAMSMEQAIELALSDMPEPAPGSQPPQSYPNDLTLREVEVLRLVAEELTSAQIAERLFLSRNTVHAHLRSIYSKVGVNTRSAAARFATEHGLA